ncbi:MAG: putative short-chain type dehydrogenase/reductase [Ilumatobacteraceae bacterium]|nr:putative short-chain type dehydrogenase/reductase [Ilumatobacteraceae bacterium]
MSELRFDGRVAVVTGAGRGIGRGYAALLAERGAQVVVNDLGSSKSGVGADDGPARSVVDEIVAAGGVAISDANDVSNEAGAAAIVDAAIGAFGRIDIVVNNAGIIRWADLPEADLAGLQSTLDVHLIGSFNVSRAAWPHMVAQQYGRIVMTTSTGMLGLPGNLAYAAAKAGLVGLARNMRLSGAKHGITTNLIAPVAYTRMGGAPSADPSPADAPPLMAPTMVAPMVAYLCHEDCPVSGEIYVAGGGRFSRLFIASTNGYVQTDGQPTPEDIAAHWAEINDETAYSVPMDLPAWAAEHLRHMT